MGRPAIGGVLCAVRCHHRLVPDAIARVEFYPDIRTRLPTPTRSLLVRFDGEELFAGAVVLSSDEIAKVAADATGQCELAFLHNEVEPFLTPGTTFTIHYPPSLEIGRGAIVARRPR